MRGKAGGPISRHDTISIRINVGGGPVAAPALISVTMMKTDCGCFA